MKKSIQTKRGKPPVIRNIRLKMWSLEFVLKSLNRFPVHVPRGAHEFSWTSWFIKTRRGPPAVVDRFAWYRLRNCASVQQVESRMPNGAERKFLSSWSLSKTRKLASAVTAVAEQLLLGMWKPSWCCLKSRPGRVEKVPPTYFPMRFVVSDSQLHETIQLLALPLSISWVRCNVQCSNRHNRHLWSQLLLLLLNSYFHWFTNVYHTLHMQMIFLIELSFLAYTKKNL